MEMPESVYFCFCGISEVFRKELGSDNSERPKVFGLDVTAAGLALGETRDEMGSRVACLL